MKGDKRCCICGAWIGNYVTGETPEGTASYYSIIRKKYCDECRPWKRQLDIRFNCREYRKRKREFAKERERTITLLKAENQALRQIIAEMREKQ